MDFQQYKQHNMFSTMKYYFALATSLSGRATIPELLKACVSNKNDHIGTFDLCSVYQIVYS